MKKNNIYVNFKNKINKSLKFKLFFTIFSICFFIVICCSLITYSYSYNMIKKYSLDREKANLEIISKGLDTILNIGESCANSLIVNNVIQESLVNISLHNIMLTDNHISSIKVELNQISFLNEIVEGAIVYSINGLYIKSHDSLPLTKVNKNLKTNFIWKGPIAYKNEKFLISIFKKVFHKESGKLIGYVELFLNEKYFSDNYNNNSINSNYLNLELIDNNGFISSSLQKDFIGIPIDNAIQKNLANINEPFVSIENNGVLNLLLYYKNLNWNINASINLNNLINTNNLLFSIITMIIIGFILSLILALTVSKRFFYPIKILFNTMNDVQAGNLNAQCPINSKDELGVLSCKFNDLTSSMKKLIKEVEIQQCKKREFELELMQLQIKPHFLYNSLENISALAELEMNDELIEMVFNLSTFYRGVLNKGNYLVTIEEELNLTLSYLNILKVRYNDVFTFSIECEDPLKICTCLKLLIQPLVENAIYHGLKYKTSEGKIIIKIKKIDNFLQISIEDNGIGMTEEELKKLLQGNLTSKKGGFGVKNTIERLSLCFDKNFKFNIYSEKHKGTKITILLPLISKEEYCYEHPNNR